MKILNKYGARLLVLCCLSLWISCTEEVQNTYIFEEISGDELGLDFSNHLIDSDSMNIIQYLYFYNGAGVGVGDVNNDNLPDIFFASNQAKSKLFINRSSDSVIKFEDVTDQANLDIQGWSTGVNIVDVNGDGYMDIYLCQVNYKTLKGTNRLLINQGLEKGIPKFSDETDKYGLSFTGLSTQSAFLDYDLDGDLDMYLLNHSVHSPENYSNSSVREEPYANGDKFFRNDNGIFVDATEESGIYSSKIGFGLGLGVSDLNKDGYPDIYVGNDFHENDYLYLNNGDGTFKEVIERSTGHTSQFSMGLDIADINNDGWNDIITMDMMPEDQIIKKSSVPSESYEIYNFKKDFGYHYQLAHNNFQLHAGKLNEDVPIFSEVGQLMGVEDTDWSWSSLLVDFDCDGRRDLFVTNGIAKRPNDLDYLNYISNTLVQKEAKDTALIEQMPNGAVSNYLFLNQSNLRLANHSHEIIGNKPGLSTGAATADFDRDGDLDIVINNINDNASILVNQTNPIDYIRVNNKSSTQKYLGIGTKIIAHYSDGIYYTEINPVKGFMSCSTDQALIHPVNGMKPDSITIYWTTGEKASFKSDQLVQDLKVNQNDGVSISNDISNEPNHVKSEELLEYKHIENIYSEITSDKLTPWLLSTQGPALAVDDINGDGLDDIYIGGARGQAAELFVQSSSGSFEKSNSDLWDKESHFEDVDALFVDVDNDGDADLYVASGGNEYSSDSPFLLDRIYVNDGNGKFGKSSRGVPLVTENSSAVSSADFDNDGDLDLLVGSIVKTRSYGFSSGAVLLQNDGTGKFMDITKSIAPDLVNIGMVSDVAWDDIDEDGDEDMIIVGEWMPVTLMINQGNGFVREELESSVGLWKSITLHDVDNDGKRDLLLGNHGVNTYLSQDDKVGMLWGDYDNNNVPEPLLYLSVEGIKQPLASRDLLVSQMTVFKSLHKDYEAFANQDFNTMFGNVIAKTIVGKEVEELETCIFKNISGTSYEKIDMPVEAQIAPIYDILSVDLNDDGILDLIMGGNLYEVSPNIGRADASHGTILLGTKDGRFVYDKKYNTSLNIEGQIRQISIVNIKGVDKILIARNNDTPLFLNY